MSLQKVEAFLQICGRSCENELLMEALHECLVSPRTIFTGAVASLTLLSSLPMFRSNTEVYQDNYHVAFNFVPAYSYLFRGLRLMDLVR